jgi:hypothetical protein
MSAASRAQQVISQDLKIRKMSDGPKTAKEQRKTRNSYVLTFVSEPKSSEKKSGLSQKEAGQQIFPGMDGY